MKKQVVQSAAAVLSAAMLTACGRQGASSTPSTAGAQSAAPSSTEQAAEE